MHRILVILVIILYNTKQSVLAADRDELIAVFAISRHGDRAPFSSFPTDKYYNETYWPMGFGQLTKKGIHRHYKLGQWLRRRYDGFLGEYYHPREMYACSTNLDRTLMSAYANLAGLFPPKGYQLWNEQILWQPIPVHIVEFISLIEIRGCLKFEKMIKKLKQVLFPLYEEKHSEVMQYISNHTGWKKVNVEVVEELMDVLFTYEQHDASYIPEWSKHLDHNVTKYLSAVVYEVPTHNNQLARLRIGTLYNHIFKMFDQYIETKLSTEASKKSKFILLMAHESTLSAILNTIGAFKMEHIEYANTLFWELKKNKNNDYFVNVLYKDKDQLKKLNVLNCDFNCNYDNLKYILSNITITVEQWEKECVS